MRRFAQAHLASNSYSSGGGFRVTIGSWNMVWYWTTLYGIFMNLHGKCRGQEFANEGVPFQCSKFFVEQTMTMTVQYFVGECWWLFSKLQMLQVQPLFQAVWLHMVALTLPWVSIKWIPWNVPQNRLEIEAYPLWSSHLTRFGLSSKELDTGQFSTWLPISIVPKKVGCSWHDHIWHMDSVVPYSMPQHLSRMMM